jgi:HD-GYP domain-containing protein (c-di-GMP phosphodiesterase class II)
MMRAPRRLPIFYLIAAVLMLVSVVPIYFYSSRVTAINRERLKVNEMMLQNTITRSLGDDIGQRQSNFRSMLQNFTSVVEIASGGSLGGDRVKSPQLQALMERFVSSSNEFAYATLVNTERKGITAGRIQPDAFMSREFERAYLAAGEGRAYTGQVLTIGAGNNEHTLMLVSQPVMISNKFSGMIAVFVDLGYLSARLQDASQGGLVTYVVDRQGRLVAGDAVDVPVGQNMMNVDLVRSFVEQGGRAGLADTREFRMNGPDGQVVDMLGSYKIVQTLGWAVVAQKTQANAYQGIREMQITARLLAILAIVMSVGVGFYAAKRITTPLDVLTESSRAIARGDFSQRVALKSRTEIGELADTFNLMTGELEKLVADLKHAAEENRALFMGSIQMLAGAVDEKDPYTRGHSDRVTRYSVAIATELGLPADEVEQVRISAQLHDVGKIGIEDRILKKPGALTPEEFEIMKTHTTKGANILRPVRQLKAMIPGIELHHESLDGRGYPYGLKGDEIPTMARVIMVADTFDAMTTDRPYQKAMEPEYVVKIISSLVGRKFDADCVAALTAVFERGELGVRAKREAPQATAVAMAAVPQAAAVIESNTF